MNVIPTGVSLNTYSGDVDDFLAMPFQQLVDEVAAGTLPIRLGKAFGLGGIVDTHRTREQNAAGGKIVVVNKVG
ncbi:zinc-binding dehydrogenase [Sphingopyxis sp. YR583]|uniref:zinc-binding dehydrogenase n=1 Tax=Sphingopyxis sp. YR583 TaxID=1881047 RepID=UPI000B876FB9|nr:zinc-binding dehydrogenase [Sphingopyxis sp. YR583]